MTSELLIEKLKHIGVEEWRLAAEKIEKDLEVLEILKKYNYSHDDNTLFIALDCMKFDELKKIKKWLEQ